MLLANFNLMENSGVAANAMYVSNSVVVNARLNDAQVAPWLLGLTVGQFQSRWVSAVLSFQEG